MDERVEKRRAYRKRYYARPEVKARIKMRNQEPGTKARLKKYRAEYHARPDIWDKKKKQFRKRHLMAKYGLTIEAWDALLESQNWACAICKTVDPGSRHGWQTDHDHETGKVRGILCLPCNKLLGMVKDCTSYLGAAVSYLIEHRKD
ncbi:MAG: endonuclease VII domain-containing protein [Pirellulales bacterium]